MSGRRRGAARRARPGGARQGRAGLGCPREEHLEPRVDTAGAEITLERDGTVVIRVKHVDMTREVMADVLAGRFTLGRVRAPVLVDARRVRSMTREAQELSAGPDTLPYTDCIALLVASAVSVVLGNFFLVFVRPPFPTRMFRDEAEARAWLAATRSVPR